MEEDASLGGAAKSSCAARSASFSPAPTPTLLHSAQLTLLINLSTIDNELPASRSLGSLRVPSAAAAAAAPANWCAYLARKLGRRAEMPPRPPRLTKAAAAAAR